MSATERISSVVILLPRKRIATSAIAATHQRSARTLQAQSQVSTLLVITRRESGPRDDAALAPHQPKEFSPFPNLVANVGQPGLCLGSSSTLQMTSD